MTRAKRARVRKLEARSGGRLEVWQEGEDTPGRFTRPDLLSSSPSLTRAEVLARPGRRGVLWVLLEGGTP